MAYGKKYILSFISDRGNDYKVEVLQQGFSGAAVVKSFGSAPMLNIEDGDGRVKGSSLAFSIQADTEGELSGLYTTNNKEYKVILYRNNAIYWQGYHLPELYSENYVDPPYDVAVTATDQLATLKDVPYQGEDTLKSLLDIVKGILFNTKVDIPCKIHMQLSNAQGSLLSTSYISAAAYNGQSCYDVLNSILLSCNCSIMQMGNEWIISSYTDATTTYATDLGAVNVPHCTIGQMGSADVCPDGSLTMVNAPALKGATVEYNHIVRNSMLLNPDCKNRDNWMYTPGTIGDRFPGEIEGEDVVYKAYAWQLNQKNLKTDNALQVWQDIALEQDTTNAYSLSVKTLFTGLADLLLLSVSFSSEYGTTWYLTADGWKTGVDRTNVNGYIQVTGQSKGDVLMLQGVSDMSNYDTTTVQFMLPEVAGTLRVGVINSTSDYSDPLPYRVNQIYVTGVYLTIANVTGKTSTTVVEKNATSAQEEVAISYGEAISSPNADKMDLSYLRYADGQRIESVELSGEEFSSYYLAMVQDLSRYYGVKKMQLQGALMGVDVLHPIYKDVFSGKVLRLVNAQYNLLDDSASVSLEEVPSAFVEYTLTVYAKENAAQNSTTSAGGSVAVGGSDSYLGLQADGDVVVKGDRPLTGKEGRFDNLALPSAAPAGVSADKTYIFSSQPAKHPAVDISVLAEAIKEIESLGLSIVNENGKTYLKSEHSFFTEKDIFAGGLGEEGASGGIIQKVYGVSAFGQTFDSANLTDTFNAHAINSLYNDIQILKNSGGGGVADSVNWNNVYNKPTTLGGYGITDALSTSGGTIAGDLVVENTLRVKNYLKIVAWPGYGEGNTDMWYNGNTATIHSGASHIELNGNIVLHNGNYSSYALPLSGGTITHQNYGAFELKRNYANYDSAIKYSNVDDGLLGYIGIGGSATANAPKAPYYSPNGDTEYALLHAGNYSSYALPLSGGVVGDLVINATSDAFLQILLNGASKALVGWQSNHGVRLYNYTSASYLSIKDDGTPTYNGNTLIHSGNIGSQSVNSLYYNDASLGNYYFKPYDYGYLLEGQYPTLRIKNTNIYNSQIEFSDRDDILRWSLSYRGFNNADNDFYFFKVSDDVATPILGLDYSSGNVLIGTTTDWGYKLGVYGATFITIDGDYGILIGAGSNTIDAWRVGGNSADLFLNWQSSGHIKMVTGGGNVLIGTTTDNVGKLQVEGVVVAKGFKSQTLSIECNSNGSAYSGYGWEINNYNAPLYIQSGSNSNLVLCGGGGNVLIDSTSDDGHKLSVNGSIKSYGDIIATNWLYGGENCGMYITNTGVYYSNNYNYANIESGSNEICIGGNADSMYVNYRVPRHYGIAPKEWIWCAGSSASRATFFIGELRSYGISASGDLVATGDITAGSDERYKRIESYAEIDINTIANAPIINFKWTDREDDRVHLGSTAQYWANTSLCNGVIPTDDEKLWTMNYGTIALGGLVSVAKKVVNHEERIAVLERENKELREELKQYRRA